MYTDSRGHQLSAQDSESAHLCSNALESFCRRQSDTIPLLQQSIAIESDNAFSQALYGLMLHGARKASLQADIKGARDIARQTTSKSTHREKLYVQALTHACDGDLFSMVDRYEDILRDNPCDLLALTLAQGELFWLGESKHALRLSEMVKPAWGESITGYPEYLSILAFDLEEARRYDEAESIGKQSVALRADNAWGTHAVAHVLYMQGRHREGIDWLTEKQDRWDQTNQIKYHIWWHQCLFHLEQGEHEAVLEDYDRWVRNRDEPLVQVTPDLYIDMQNGASMLWRLEQQGIDVGNRWEEMAALAIPRLEDMTSPFTSAHYAVILAATNQFDECERLLTAMTGFARQRMQTISPTLSPRYHDAAIPAAIAAIEHRKANYQNVLDILMPERQHLWQMGGSHAQQDLFHQILVDAAVKLKQQSTVKTLLKEIEAIGFAVPTDSVAYKQAGTLAA